jgi:hypothetical protein
MALPNIPNPQKMTYPAAVPDMANQVIFEGFLARSWVHNNCRFLRLANQRPPQAGRQSDGRLMVESDYVTVRLDPSVYFDMDRATPGLRLVARGRIEGHDIPETIGDILRHCNLNIRVPQDIQHITVSRPAVQIFCTSIEFRKDKPGINQQQSYQHNKNHRHSDRPFRPTQRVSAPSQQPAVNQTADAIQATPAGPSKGGVQPGQDVSDIAAAIDARKGKKTAAPAKPAEEAPKKGAAAKKAAAKKAAEKSAKSTKKDDRKKSK